MSVENSERQLGQLISFPSTSENSSVPDSQSNLTSSDISTDSNYTSASFPVMNTLNSSPSTSHVDEIVNVEKLSDIQLDVFMEQLNSWAVECKISHNSYSKLLNILKKNLNIQIHKDARTVLKTGKEMSSSIIDMPRGSYYHFGLEESILYVLEKINYKCCGSDILKLEVNVDGLPLAKSSNSQFWPILVNIENIGTDFVFPVGVFHGSTKPADPNNFQNFFSEDFVQLKHKGICYQGKILNIEITKILCDAPAKAFVLCVKNHNSYFGCTKCITEGDFVNNRMTYPDTHSRLRTDDSFIEMVDDEYHKNAATSLLKLGIGLVSKVPLDYMHLVCLGVMKRLLTFWVKGNRTVRLFTHQIDDINNRIHDYSKCSVLEFSRKPRSLYEVDRWKATEFRQFLLYYGPIIMKQHLSESQYLHFLSLHCAIRIFASCKLCIKYNMFANALIMHFVERCGDLYGFQYVNHNVHNLINLAANVLMFGPLDKFSCFKFENFMHTIKMSLKSTKHPLKQFVNKVYEYQKYSRN